MAHQVRIGVIDSGVHAEHPHVGGVAGGVGIGCPDYIDRLGHGTAVAAAIREKAPDAEIFAVKIFHDRLAAPVERLLAALEWCTGNGMHFINLSLGTKNPAHDAAIWEAAARVSAAGVTLVTAWEWLPAPVLDLPHVAAVSLDWECPREEIRKRTENGRELYAASGYPRPIPGVPVERNLQGISFAVANVTGSLAAVLNSAV